MIYDQMGAAMPGFADVLFTSMLTYSEYVIINFRACKDCQTIVKTYL